jgi:hypothetical protein
VYGKREKVVDGRMHWWVRDGGIRVDKESDAGGVCTFSKCLNSGVHVGGCVAGGC